MKFKEYLDVYGVPEKVIAMDVVDRFETVHEDNYCVPVVLGMDVDHVELNRDYPRKTVVFLRCPKGVMI